MIKFRLVLLLGFIGLFIGIADSVINNNYYWLLGSYIYTLFVLSWVGVGVALHRYICHRTFKTNKLMHRILCYLSILPGHGTPIDFSMLHRHHHKHSDTELDTHNPKHGFWHSWLLYGTYKADWYRNVKQLRQIPKDLYRDSTIKFVHDHYYKIILILSVTALLINWRLYVYFVSAPMAFSMLHNFFFSWTSHVEKFPGNYRNFNTDDCSQNNRFVSLLVCELHNNHHANPHLYNEATELGEFDPAGYLVDHLFIEHNTEKQHNF